MISEECRDKDSLEQTILGRLNRFKGLTCSEIEKIVYDEDRVNIPSKNYYSTLTNAMLDVKGKKYVKELIEANIYKKTVRIHIDGRSKESMSFPAFRYDEIIEQTWETSDLYEQLNRRFLFTVFQFTTKKATDEQKDLRFLGAFFWSIPESDLKIVRGVWEDTKEKINQERFDEFVKASDRRISHVRPHGTKQSPTFQFRGMDITKRCFWLNSDYIERVVRNEFLLKDCRELPLRYI